MSEKTEFDALVATMMEKLRPQYEEAARVAAERLAKEYATMPLVALGGVSSLAVNARGVNVPAVSTPSPFIRAVPAPERPKVDWTKVMKQCKFCGKTKHVLPLEGGFGITHNRNGTERAQGRCNQCRATVNYRHAPRKYKKRR